MSPGVLWASIKDLLFREATLATPGSLAFKRAAQIRQVSHAMPQSCLLHSLAWLDQMQTKNVHSPIRLPREIQTFLFSVFT